MNFEPKTKKQIAEDRLLPAGVYAFEVTKAEDKTSKKGNEMIELELNVFDDQNRQYKLRDWLGEFGLEKLYNFCEVGGILAKYEAGNLKAYDCVGVNGWCKVRIQKGDLYYPEDKNSIGNYVPQPDAPAHNARPVASEELPF